MADGAYRELQRKFGKLYAKTGRPSTAPEKLLFRWFVGLNMDDAIWAESYRKGYGSCGKFNLRDRSWNRGSERRLSIRKSDCSFDGRSHDFSA
jgi:hypothetical protein